MEMRNACAQGAAWYVIFLPLRSFWQNEWDADLLSKLSKINVLAKSVLGFSIILGGCMAIAVGVAGGYRSPLSTSAEAGAADAAAADVRSASLLALPSNSGPQSHD
jgi:hypothetical protein